MNSPREISRHGARILLAVALILAGLGHLGPSRLDFQAQVPPWLPFDPHLVVYLSGVMEIHLGVALLLARKRRAEVGWLTALFFVLVFPGNLSQWLHHRNAFHLDTDQARFVRLFFQPVLIAWALWSTAAWVKRPWNRVNAQDDDIKPPPSQAP